MVTNYCMRNKTLKKLIHKNQILLCCLYETMSVSACVLVMKHNWWETATMSSGSQRQTEKGPGDPLSTAPQEQWRPEARCHDDNCMPIPAEGRGRLQTESPWSKNHGEPLDDLLEKRYWLCSWNYTFYLSGGYFQLSTEIFTSERERSMAQRLCEDALFTGKYGFLIAKGFTYYSGEISK